MKILLTGASGFLGKRIVGHYSNEYTFVTPSHCEFEIRDEQCCLKAVKEIGPDYVIHMAAVSDTGTCERNPESTYRTNVTGSENLARACAAAGSRLIFASSDQVYNGNCTAVYNRETDVCRPVNVYGRQKLEAEQRILRLLPDAVILRLTWMYDISTPQMDTKENFLTRIIAAVENQQKITYSDQELRGITYVNEVVHNLKYAFDLPGGIYNFGSYPQDSTYMLARQTAIMLDRNRNIDHLIERDHHAMPRNLAMDQKNPNQYRIYFSENGKGLSACLKERGMI
ncbi:MAG: SDR family oxidoreductase [Lachnospiraceae bacterium]